MEPSIPFSLHNHHHLVFVVSTTAVVVVVLVLVLVATVYPRVSKVMYYIHTYNHHHPQSWVAGSSPPPPSSSFFLLSCCHYPLSKALFFGRFGVRQLKIEQSNFNLCIKIHSRSRLLQLSMVFCCEKNPCLHSCQCILTTKFLIRPKLDPLYPVVPTVVRVGWRKSASTPKSCWKPLERRTHSQPTTQRHILPYFPVSYKNGFCSICSVSPLGVWSTSAALNSVSRNGFVLEHLIDARLTNRLQILLHYYFDMQNNTIRLLEFVSLFFLFLYYLLCF